MVGDCGLNIIIGSPYDFRMEVCFSVLEAKVCIGNIYHTLYRTFPMVICVRRLYEQKAYSNSVTCFNGYYKRS